MKHGFHIAVVPRLKQGIKVVHVHVVGNAQIGQVAKLVAHAQIVNCNDVVDASRVQTLNEVAANKTGGSGHHNFVHEGSCSSNSP